MEPRWKLVLSRAGQTTRGYDMERVIKIQLAEEEDSGISEVLLDNSDFALNDLNFEQFQGIIYFGYYTAVARSIWVKNTAYAVNDVVTPTTLTGYQYRCTIAGTSHASTEPTWGTALGVTQTDGSVTWEMDGNTGDEYAPRAPLKVEAQEFQSSETQLTCRLYLTGIPNDLAGDKAESAYTQESGDTNTVKALLDKIAGATLTPYTNYPAVTLTYDTGYDDSIINAFKPADYFSVSVNQTRDDKISELLAYTHCRRRAKADGAIHIFQPTLTGTTYDYEYQLAVDTYHTFFSKALRHRFVNPNKEIVSSHPDQGSFTGSATSATSYALRKKIRTTYRRVTSSAQAGLIAAAIIERTELAAERGSAVVPMNCGQELFDYVKITDARENSDYRVGNVQYLQFNCALGTASSEGRFDMTIRFGKLNLQSISALLGEVAGVAGVTGAAQQAGINQDLLNTIYTMLDDITALFKNQLTMLTEGFRIDQTLFYGAGYDPSSKRRVFTSTPTTPYDVGDLWADGSVYKRCTTARASGAYNAADWTTVKLDEIADGTTYSRVLTTSISVGKILLPQADGTLDNIVNGTTYGKVLLTDLSFGHIHLTSATVSDGVWYHKSGVYIGAEYGIGLYGTGTALRTYPTYDDLVNDTNLQCYVGTDGKIKDGTGAVSLGSGGIVSAGASIKLYTGATLVGVIDGNALGFFLTSDTNQDLQITALGTGNLLLVGTHVDLYCPIDMRSTYKVINLVDPTSNQEAATKKYVDDNAGGGAISYSAPTRVLDTVYQNTSGKNRAVTVSIALTFYYSVASWDDVLCLIGATNNPASLVAAFYTSGGGDDTYCIMSATFFVPPNWYYKVLDNHGDPVISSWAEWDW